MSTEVQTLETENAKHFYLSGGRYQSLGWSLRLGAFPVKDNAFDPFIAISLREGSRDNLAMCHLTKDEAVAWATALLDAVKEINRN